MCLHCAKRFTLALVAVVCLMTMLEASRVPQAETVDSQAGTLVDSRPEAENEATWGIFDNFFDPQREPERGGSRFGKRRGVRMFNEAGEDSPSNKPLYEPEPQLPPEPQLIAASPNIIVGRIVSVNLYEKFVVAWMQSRFIELNREVITRNHELETTALLQPTPFRNSLAYGLEIISGVPKVGDELVLPEVLVSTDATAEAN